MTIEFLVLDGDILVLGSDGVFDNLFQDQIIECLETGYANPLYGESP